MDNTNLSPFLQEHGLAAEDSHINTTSAMHASLANSCWPPSQVPPIHQTSFFPLQNRASDLDYPSPASSVPSPPYQPHSHQHAAVNNSAITPDKIIHSFPQVESVIGPDRVLTRRQRGTLDQTILGRRMSVSSTLTRGDRQGPVPRPRSDIYFPPSASSRPQTPEAAKLQAHRDRLSLTTDSALLPHHSPTYKPMTPTSVTSPYSPYSYYPSQPRSEPSVQTPVEPRQGSPSNSITSSVSLSGTAYEGGPIRTPHPVAPPRVKHKKQRLSNTQRKQICEYAEKNPNARQEDMATLWHVERSTVSKILKNKDKWLRAQDDYSYTSKHREATSLQSSKFPEIEQDLEPWLKECHEQQISITDALIRAKAKEVAQRRDIPEDRFKASSGWIENFKQRQGIKNTKLTSNGKDIRARHTYVSMDPLPIPGAVASVREHPLQASVGRLNNGSPGYPPPSWPGYSQSERTYPLLEGASVLHNSPTSEHHPRNDTSFSTRFQGDQHGPPDYSAEPVPNIDQAYEALTRLRQFLDSYHRREYLINPKDDDLLAKLAQRMTRESTGTLIDKA